MNSKLKLNGLKVLAVGAHPDDIEVYMAGTLLKYKQLGSEIHFVIATNGCKGGKVSPEVLSATREQEAKRSATQLEVDPIFLDYNDGELVYDQTIYKKIINLIHSIRPDIVFTHNPEDYHSDHRILSRLIFDAASFKVPVVYFDSLMGVNFRPQFYVDITEEFKLKEQMIREHQSQLYTGILEMVQLQNQFRGVQSSFELGKYAEAYALATHHKSGNVFRMLPF